ncbi:MAG TPA: response regulator [Thermoanaerobaculia bacterium]
MPTESPISRPILIVEDDEPTQKLLIALLKRSSLTGEIAGDGREAIAMLKTGDYAAVILDLMMPEISGRDVIHYLSGVDDPVPVVVCSAAGPSALSGFDQRVVKAVVRKPFDVDQFSDTLFHVARR